MTLYVSPMLDETYSRITDYNPPNPVTPVGYYYRRLRIPKSLAYLVAVHDVLAFLTLPGVWGVEGEDDEITARALMGKMVLDYMESNLSMLGTIFPYVTQDVPVDCLPCNGSTYAGSDYPDLFAVLDSTLKSGNNFTTPDLRGKFVLGVNASHAKFTTGGAETHTLTVNQIPAHHHYHQYSAMYALINGGLEAPALAAQYVDANTADTGGGQAHNNMPPYYSLNYAIVAR